MQVSCGKLTVNDGKQMGGTTSHNRTVRWRYTVGNCVFRRLEKFFTLWPAYKSLPQLLGQDFVVNFATYTRVYTVLLLPAAKVPWVELLLHGTFTPWNFCSLELLYPGTFAPESESDMELSHLGTLTLCSQSSVELLMSTRNIVSTEL